MHRLLLSRGVTLAMSVPLNDIKQSDGEVPVMLELWGALLRCYRTQIHPCSE